MTTEQSSRKNDRAVAAFYDEYWPKEVPLLEKTLEHIVDVVPEGDYELALDAGCGSGACSLALARLARKVVCADISLRSLLTANRISIENGAEGRLHFVNSSIEALPLRQDCFDLILSWGACHHAENPYKAMDELARALKPGGTLVVALYKKTALTPLHEAARKICLLQPGLAQKIIIPALAAAAHVFSSTVGRRPMRDDSRSLSSKIVDWYLVPRKHFFDPAKVRKRFEAMGFQFRLIAGATGRFKSTSNFIAIIKKGTSPETQEHSAASEVNALFDN